MKRVGYPSVELQPTPPFTFGLPDGWSMTEIPQGWCALHPDEQPTDTFWTHCSISSVRVTTLTKLSQASIANFVRLKKQYPDATITTQHAGRFGERPTYMRGVDFTGAGDLALSQVVGLFYGPRTEGRDIIDIFSVIGTVPREHLSDIGPRFVEIIASFEFPSNR